MKNKQKLKRPYQKIIRFDRTELDYINEKVEASFFNNFQNFARTLLIQGEVKLVDYTPLEDLVGEVNRIGNNINQIVALANHYKEVSEEDIATLSQLMKEVKDLTEGRLKSEIKSEKSV